MSDHEIEAAKRLLERHNYKVLGPHEGEWAPDPRESEWTDDGDTDGERAVRNALGLCGCGQPDRVTAMVRDCLDAIHLWSTLSHAHDPRADAMASVPDRLGAILVASPGAAGELVAQFLDAADCLEHGTSVNWARLSKKGEWMLEQLSKAAT